MTKRKQVKARIPEFDKERFKQELGDTTENDYIAGAIYDLIERDAGTEYYEGVANLRQLRGEVAEIDGRIEQINERIDELEEKREDLRKERDEKQERIEDLEIQLAETPEPGTTEGGSSVEDVAYDLLVDIAHGKAGTNGLTAGEKAVKNAALSVQSEPDEMIATLRRMSEQASKSDRLKYVDDPLERGFIKTDQLVQDRLDKAEFDRVRRAIAEEVLDDDDVKWDEIPEEEFGA